jgi:hypothetical protein
MAKVLLTSQLLTKIRKMAFLVVAARVAGHRLVVLPGFLVEEIVGHQMAILLAFLVLVARVAGHQLVVLPGFLVEEIVGHQMAILLAFLVLVARVAGHQLVVLPGFMDTKMDINADILFAHLLLGLLVYMDIDAVIAHQLVGLLVSSAETVVK